MAKNPFVFPSTFSNSQSSIPSSSSSSPSPSFNSSSSYPSSPSLTSPFQPSHQSLPSPRQTSSSHFSWPSNDVVGPCAACKILRRQCTDKCYLASYFPSTTEPHNFTVVGSLFGLSDVHEFLQSGSVLKCVHALSCPGNKFHSCVFHPTYPSLLVIGGYQCLGLWNMAESRTMTLFAAHEGLISALAVSPLTSLIASASHDKLIKLWK
ncbi:hypothetical protein JCGZ_06683 [Jatropha curcas]|uniref:LOB domain-containing protein n=1 Tax=Jatropha curcas TaxID=180498 RepID=A0A067LCP3_JATCU|nr:hypothetical protein JCGZ_06683 [Jatropha curcas]